MKSIMRFYREVLNYIQTDEEIEGAVQKIVALAQKASPSWEATEESVAFLEKTRNRGSSEVTDDDVWSTTFRDLSPLKDEAATDLFKKVADGIGTTFNNGDDMLVWARTVKERTDGSGVLVLHVTDLKRFRDLIEDHHLVDSVSDHHSLEGGVLIGS